MWNTDYYGYPMDYAWWWIVLGSLLLHAWCFFRLTKDRGGRVAHAQHAGEVRRRVTLHEGHGLDAEDPCQRVVVLRRRIVPARPRFRKLRIQALVRHLDAGGDARTRQGVLQIAHQPAPKLEARGARFGAELAGEANQREL